MRGTVANIWLTTTHENTVVQGLAPQANIRFALDTANGNQVIDVNDALTYQQMVGFGASMTDSSAWLLNSSNLLSIGTRAAVMEQLFDPINGIGINFLRNPMGASDFARFAYTYDDNAADQNDSSLPNFSIQHDLADIVPMTLQAKAINPRLKIAASPWSPPAWMKTVNSLLPFVEGNPNSINSQYYPHLATYFVKTIQAYAAQGIPIDFVTLQNEPGCCTHLDYPGTAWDSDVDLSNFMDTFLKNHLLPAFSSNQISTRILLHDFNWGDFQKVVPLLQDSALMNSSQIAGVSWHGYWPVNPSTYAEQSTIYNAYGQKDVYFTERSGGAWNSSAAQQAQDFQDIIGVIRNWGKTFIKWNLALDENYGPHSGGCGNCTGLVTIHRSDGNPGKVDYTIEYYTMGHLSKFVCPGAYRIDSTENADVLNVAFKNPDGSTVLIAYNNTALPQTFKVVSNGESFNYTLPVSTGATFKWISATTNLAN